MRVVKAIHGAAGNHDDLSGPYLRDLSFDGKGEYAFEAIGGLFVAIVAMGPGTLLPGATSNSNMATVLFASCPSTR